MLDDTLSLQILLLTEVLSNTSLSLRFVIWANCWLWQRKCTCWQKPAIYHAVWLKRILLKVLLTIARGSYLASLLCWTHRCTIAGSGSSISHWLGNRFQGSTGTDWVTRGSRSTVAYKTGPRKPHKHGKLDCGSWQESLYCLLPTNIKPNLS